MAVGAAVLDVSGGESLGLIGQATSGIITTQSFAQFIAWIPALLIGVAIGAKGFKHMDQAKFRKAVLLILIALAVVTLVKAGLDLSRPA